MRSTLAGAAMAVVLLIAAPAAAQPLDPITDRDYGIDLYTGAAIGSVRVVGMGGAAIALEEGSAGSISNPAMPAARPATSNGRWDWDWHVDWLNPGLGSDFDNNGIDTEEGFGGLLITGGLVLQYAEWALGVSIVSSTRDVELTEDEIVTPSATTVRLQLARSFYYDTFTAGVGVRVGEFGVTHEDATTPERKLFGIIGTAIEAGFLFKPPLQSVRAGLTATVPISGERVTVNDCDPMDCAGFILPEKVLIPWQVGIGAAYRYAPTAWNRKVRKRWRDERALLVAADLVFTGPVNDGNGIEAFAMGQLQPSGRDLSVSVRGGVEYEVIPGWLRLRAGSYWEPPRFEGVGGRVHGTFGIEGRLFSFKLWGKRYRVRASLTGDLADDYANTGLSVGFWH